MIGAIIGDVKEGINPDVSRRIPRARHARKAKGGYRASSEPTSGFSVSAGLPHTTPTTAATRTIANSKRGPDAMDAYGHSQNGRVQRIATGLTLR